MPAIKLKKIIVVEELLMLLILVHNKIRQCGRVNGEWHSYSEQGRYYYYRFVCAKRRHLRFISIDHTRCPLFHSKREHQNERKRQKDNEKAYFLLAQMAKSEAQLLP